MIKKTCLNRAIAIILIVFILIISPLIYYQKAVYAEPFTLTAGATLIAKLMLGAIAGYFSYVNSDVIAEGTNDFIEQISEAYQSAKIASSLVWTLLSYRARAFYEQLSTGSISEDIMENLDTGDLTEIQTDVQEVTTSGKISKEILEKYQGDVINAVGINSVLTNSYEENTMQQIEGYTLVDGLYHYEINKPVNYEMFHSLNYMTTYINTTLKVIQSNYTDDDLHKEIRFEFIIGEDYYELIFDFMAYMSRLNSFKWEYEGGFNDLKISLYENGFRLDSDTIRYFQTMSNNTTLYELEDIGIDISFLENLTAEEVFIDCINLGGTGIKTYQPVFQTVLDVPIIPDTVISNDDVQEISTIISNQLINDDTYQIDIDYTGSDVVVGDVTVSEDGTITMPGDATGDGTITIDGPVTVTIPETVTVTPEVINEIPISDYNIPDLLKLLVLILIAILKFFLEFLKLLIAIFDIPSDGSMIPETSRQVVDWFKNNTIPVFNMSLIDIITYSTLIFVSIRIAKILSRKIRYHA